MNWSQTVRLFREMHLSSLSRLGNLRQPPVMILGCGRSGTSMLLSMLGAHPQIQAIGIETNIFNQPRRWNSDRLNHWNNMRKITDFILREPLKETADRWLEKTPTNVWYIPELLREFRNQIKLIHIIRDGRDVVTSVHPTRKGEYWVRPERWIRDVQLGLEYESHPCMYTIRYEEIIADKEGQMKALFDFLGLQMHENVLEHDRRTTVRRINAWEGEVQAVHSKSVEKWKRPEHAEIVAELIEKQAPFQLLERLGYSTPGEAING